MLREAIWAVVGMIAGVLTSLFFERRALAESRAEAEQLKEELEKLKLGILTIGGGSARRAVPGSAGGSPEALLRWLRAHQDAAGRVGLDHMMTHFMAEWSKPDIEQALSELSAEGSVAVEDEWVRIR